MVTIQEVLKKAVDQFQTKNINTPLLDAEVLLCHVLGVERWHLYVNRNRMLSAEQQQGYEGLLEKRMQGIPVQYLTHRQEFMGLDFYVEEGVLIPRPDTEILVEKVLDWVKIHGKDKEQIRIADIGTGSGAITVSLAKYIPKAFVYSVDISEQAQSIGKKNARSLGTDERIRFLLGDLLKPLGEQGLENQLDILVSNPPYIPSEEIETLQIEVAQYEPRLALDGGKDGLDFYRRLVEGGHGFIKDGGLIALEVGHNQAEAVKKLMERQDFYADIEKIRDLSGIERVVAARVQKKY